jgi:hypothetical protein
MAPDAEAVEGFHRIQIEAFSIIRVARVAADPVARRAFLKLAGFGHFPDRVMASCAGDVRGSFVREKRVRVRRGFMLFMIE